MTALKFAILFFVLILNILSILTVHASNKCDRSCGNSLVPYPFGFSSGCHIRLNCSSIGHILVGEFPVQAINSDNMKLIIQPTCTRSIQTFRQLFTHNYAPTARNALLLNDCSNYAVTACEVPSLLDVQTQYESFKCHSNGRSDIISCYSEEKGYEFLDYDNVTRRQCKYLFSSISAEPSVAGVSLDIQVMELGWWLEGSCNCSKDANCTPFSSPGGRQGFRCQCRQGFRGDGYHAGIGCHKDCKTAKYISGQCGGKIRTAVLIGGSVAGAFFIISLGLVCFLIRRRSYSKTRNRTIHHLSQAKGISISIYSYKEIEKATNGFSEKQRLGTGAYGTVYQGKLHNNDPWVAIKRIKQRETDSIEQVVNEIKLLSSVSHPNLVRLLGCSIEHGEQILVYEFMPNGTLCQHLQRERGHGLAWPVRLTIATETAQAIAHLHSAINPPIYHRDIKSSNILLDYNFMSKVADFGLSRLGKTEISHISTAPQGTPGYLDPQYHQNFHLSDKSDVYSFGVVLVEIITALKVVDFSRPQNEVNLAAFASDRIGKGHLDEIIDPFLEPHSDAWTFSSVHKVAELAFRCLAFHQDMRPSMMEVAAELEQIRMSRWASSEEINFTTSPEPSPCSSFSNISEKWLSVSVKNGGVESRRRFLLLHTEANNVDIIDGLKETSPVSVQDHWLIEQSSPSSISLLSNVVTQ